MRLPLKVSDNLHFLIAEVSLQVSNLHYYFENRSPILQKRILDRSGYVYNLKTGIHKNCLTKYAQEKLSTADQISLKSIELIATDLERIADICRECVKRSTLIKKKLFRQTRALTRLIQQVERGINLIEPAIQDNETAHALKLGRIKSKLDKECVHLTNTFIKQLKKKKQTESHISTLFIINEIENMGERLLAISESIISANLGHPINFDRYFSLQSSIEQLPIQSDITDEAVQIETIAETRSGSAISGISTDSEDGKFLAVYKEGKKHKLSKERKRAKSWDAIYPGLTPKILGYNQQGQSASLLIEHLEGITFEQMLLDSSPKVLNNALKQLNKTLQNIWKSSKRKESVNANFTQQLLTRLDDVYAVHPEFIGKTVNIGQLSIPSFSELIKQVQNIEQSISAPFSVYIHGDFNLDNILYEPDAKRINFIDIHRSQYMDYIQDVSVFMVSNYRMQIMDTPIRQKILALAQDFYSFAKEFAKKQNDTTFELRLALGLARSFVTSTRFILDKSLARAMFYRARYIIERVLEADLEHPKQFKLPIKEIFVG